ncbi:MAG TPA: hypothetical protein VHC22_16170 [Pirellulales bacterium]|nr:hypothetical protein [Pirellulales bacterium]
MVSAPDSPRWWSLLIACMLLLALASGCATTTATVETTLHSSDATYRFQSSDVTARLQMEWKR